MGEEWIEYQEDAARFFRSLGLTAEVEHEVQGARAKHAIDVYVTFEKWGMQHEWIVECKMHARPVCKADVETLKSIASDIGVGMAFLLSESGFQSGALDAANRTNIVLTSLQELRAKSADELLRVGVSVLEARAFEALQTLHSFMQETERGDCYSLARVRDGVDGKLYFGMIGMASMAKTALERTRFNKLPVMLPDDIDDDPHLWRRCSNTDDAVREAARVIQHVEDWISRQSPT